MNPTGFTAELALLLGNAIRGRDLALLQDIIHEMAISLADLDARWAFRVTQGNLSGDDQTWFLEAIREMRSRL